MINRWNKKEVIKFSNMLSNVQDYVSSSFGWTTLEKLHSYTKQLIKTESGTFCFASFVF